MVGVGGAGDDPPVFQTLAWGWGLGHSPDGLCWYRDAPSELTLVPGSCFYLLRFWEVQQQITVILVLLLAQLDFPGETFADGVG